MTSIPLTFRPTIPPNVNVGVVLKRLPEAAKVVPEAVPPEVCPVPKLPPGADVWYYVWNGRAAIGSPATAIAAVIPYKLYDGILSEDTPNDDYTVDDDHEYEGDIPDFDFGAHGPQASAWWVLAVPISSPGCWVTIDTWLTTGGETAAKKTDTNLAILTATDGVSWAPLTFDDAAVRFDFTGLSLVAYSDDDPDPHDPTRPYTSKLTNIALDPGKTYFIRVDCANTDNVPQTYRLRLSLTETAP